MPVFYCIGLWYFVLFVKILHSKKNSSKKLHANPCTLVVTEINGHRDKRSSEITTQKWFKGLNKNTTHTKCHGEHCLRLFFYLVCVRFCYLLCLDLKTLKTIYLFDRLS